jgi:nickel transport system permease protein
LRNYVIKRLIATVPLLIGITLLCYGFISLIPSDPAEVALRVRQIPIITKEAIAEMRQELGLDDPFLVRYIRLVGNCLQLDFGVSYTNPARTVLGEIIRCIPSTLQLAGLSLIFVIILSLPIGFLSAVYRDSWFDRILRGTVFMTTAMPAYWVGLLLIWLFSLKFDLFPTSGYGGIRHLILPSFTVSLTYISTYIRLIRNNMLDNMKQEYVLYANVRGLNQRVILTKHVLKNSLQSCITAIGMSIPQMISGTIVVENVFA